MKLIYPRNLSHGSYERKLMNLDMLYLEFLISIIAHPKQTYQYQSTLACESDRYILDMPNGIIGGYFKY